MKRILSLALLCIGLMPAGPAVCQCTPEWATQFLPGDLWGPVYCLGTFDDGTGPAMYAGGTLARFGGAPYINIAKWTQTGWTTVGGPVTGNPQTGEVWAMATFDDGSGPALYIGGQILQAAGVPVGNVARWNGIQWTPVGTLNGTVRALCIHDDGSGPALFAGGDFSTSGSNFVSRIARWNGTSWVEVGAGAGGTVRCLLSSSVGGSPALYAGGDFTTIGGLPADHLGKWDGSSWQAVGGGLTGINVTVRALAAHDDGSGPALYVGGNFAIPQPFGEPTIYAIARWTGVWSGLGLGIGGASGDSGVYSLTILNTAAGPRLYAGGNFGTTTPTLRNISGWNGSTWLSMDVGPQTSDRVFALAAADVGQGPRLFVGGSFDTSGPYRSRSVSTWTGTAWAPLGNGAADEVKTVLATEEGGNEVVYIGGRFTSIGPVQAQRIGRWNGTAWSALGSGLSGGTTNSPAVYDMVKFNDGTGDAIYAGGSFLQAGGVNANNIARWNGVAWSPLAAGLNNTCLALAAFDHGTGPMLYAGGTFTTAGTTSAVNIARWTGTAWQRLTNPGLDGTVSDMVIYTDGSGPALYVAGAFSTAGGLPAAKIVRWNGTTWSTVGAGFNNGVLSLAVHNDGLGPALYAGGEFIFSGATPTPGIARWNGTSWTTLATGIGGLVFSMASFNDGSGPALYAAGGFATAGTVHSPNIIRWTGTQFTPVGSGATGLVSALAVSPDAGTLYLGGDFVAAADVPSARIAALSGCPFCYANCDGSSLQPLLTPNDFACFLNLFATGNIRANCDHSVGTPALTPNDFLCFLNEYANGCP